MVDIISVDEAKVIGFDIGFLEPDEDSSLKFISKIDQQISRLKIRDSRPSKFIEDSKTSEDNGLNLANSIKRSRSKCLKK